MSSSSDGNNSDEISLLDIYYFFRDGWVTLASISVMGLLIGLGISFVLPEKYQARALIEPGQVGYVTLDQGVASREIEPLATLAEKMKAPGFYAEQTLLACGLSDETNPRQKLVSELSPGVARDSSFVSVSFEAESIEEAKRCIESVLSDVVTVQEQNIRAVTNYTLSEIENVQAQLARANDELETRRLDRDQNAELVRDQLAVARSELSLLEASGQSEANNVSAITQVRALNKRSEVQQFEALLLTMQDSFRDQVSQTEDKINRLSSRLTALQAAIEQPNTRPPQFATPIFAPDVKVSPKRGLITVLSLILGGFIGLMFLIGRRAIKHIQEHEARLS